MANVLVLNSGSNGNCYLIRCSSEILVLELGISYKEIISNLNKDEFSKISGCIVSHRHTDHFNDKTCKKFQSFGISVYSCNDVNTINDGVNVLEIGKSHKIGGFCIQPIPLKHSVENYGYIIKHDDFGKLVFITDTSEFPFKIKNVNHWLIEANYDDDIIIDNSLSNIKNMSLYQEHLSLSQCINVLKHSYNEYTQSITLIHLSSKNSNEEMFVNAVKKELSFSNVESAKKYKEVELELEDF